ncbi:MAG: RNA-binding protein [Gammaproteobacteria bacterium]|nr:RNA-binding protein [Gammaproteobacteria bacterium]
MKRLYVGNLSWGVTDGDLETLFSEFGSVRSATVITDRETGRSRGFGFVELEDGAAEKAMAELNGRDFQSRPLRVNEANDRPKRDGR